MNHKGMKNKKSLNHEGREGHEEKRNEALIFLMLFVFNHTTHEERVLPRGLKLNRLRGINPI